MTRTFLTALLAIGLAATTAFAGDVTKQTLFTNVNVYDGVTPKLVEGANVLVEGNLIKAVSTDAIDAPGAKVIDGAGRTLTPGLSDVHVHMQLVVSTPSIEWADPQELAIRMVPVAKDMLMRGFTTVRDMCGNTHGLRRAINAGVVPGPRIISAGACISPWSGHGDFMPYTAKKGDNSIERVGVTRVADGADEIRLAIREEMRKGASFIKVMIGGGVSSPWDPLDVTTYSLEELQAAVDETEAWGTYLTAHVYNDFGIERGLEAGMRTFDHMQLATRDVVARVKEAGIVISTQAAIIDAAAASADGSNPAVASAAAQAKAGQMGRDGKAFLELVAEYDVPTGFGTDFFGSFEAFRGNSPAIISRKEYFDNDTILEQLFQNNRRIFEMSGARLPYRDGPLAVIEPGAYADILLVEGDPTKDVAVFADWENKIDLVMKDGVIYRNELQ